MIICRPGREQSRRRREATVGIARHHQNLPV